MAERPWCCPEPRCTPLYLLAEEAAPGESFVCFGKANQSVEFTYDGVTHNNDLRSCHYSPLKGLIAWQENREDWEALKAGYWRALAALDAIVASTAGTSATRAGAWGCPTFAPTDVSRWARDWLRARADRVAGGEGK